MTTHVVVDGANVVGSRPDGWWRDRPGAAERLAARLAAALDGGGLGAPFGPDPHVHVVLEGAARAADPAPHPRVLVVRADADGDGAIVALTRDLGGPGVVVVTADRGLRERVRALGATCTGPATLLAALPGPETT